MKKKKNVHFRAPVQHVEELVSLSLTLLSLSLDITKLFESGLGGLVGDGTLKKNGKEVRESDEKT